VVVVWWWRKTGCESARGEEREVGGSGVETSTTERGVAELLTPRAEGARVL
jgi:hypothetical protein